MVGWLLYCLMIDFVFGMGVLWLLRFGLGLVGLLFVGLLLCVLVGGLFWVNVLLVCFVVVDCFGVFCWLLVMVGVIGLLDLVGWVRVCLV